MRNCFFFLFSFLVLSSQAQVNTLEMLFHWDDESLPGSTIYNNTYNEVWGFAVNNHEYAVIGSTMGTHIFDVTDPENSFERSFIAGGTQGGAIIHRDYHDFKGYLYAVADEGSESTLQIIDISNLPDEIEVVYDDDDLIQRVHNIFIDTSAQKLYACAAKGGDSNYKAIKIYSLEDPLNPVKINQASIIGGESIGHVHDAYVDKDTAFFNTGGDGLFIVDYTSGDPNLIDRFTSNDYPQAGYNHSGWLTEDKKYYYFADETWGSDMKVVIMNNFEDIEIGNTFNADNPDPFSIPHNQIVHNGYLYASYYYDGLQVYSLDDPENPKRAYEFLSSNIAPRNSYEGAWGVYPFLPSGNILISDMQEGLFVLKGINTPVSNEHFETEVAFSIYPNPSSNYVSIQTDETIQELKIFNAQGQLLRSYEDVAPDQHIEVSSFTGVLFVQVLTDNGEAVRKLIVE